MNKKLCRAAGVVPANRTRRILILVLLLAVAASVPVLFCRLKALRSAIQLSPDQIAQPLAHGRALGVEEAEELEDSLRWSREDPAARLMLVAYYNAKGTPGRKRLQPHVLKFIECQPRSTIFSGGPMSLAATGLMLMPRVDGRAYQKAVKLWTRLAKEDPDDARILGNAGAYLLVHDRDQAKALLRRARKLDPENPVWPLLLQACGSDRSRAQLIKRSPAATAAVCKSNVKQIGVLIRMYSKDFDGQYPKKLEDLHDRHVTVKRALVCPSDRNPRQIGKGLMCSYRYIGQIARLSALTARKVIILYDRAENHERRGRNALFYDGHAEWIREAAVGRRLKESYELVKKNPPKPKPTGYDERIEDFYSSTPAAEARASSGDAFRNQASPQHPTSTKADP